MSIPFALTLGFLISAGLSGLGTFLVRHWARKRGRMDVPDRIRRVHDVPTPNAGGVAVGGAAVITFALCAALTAGRPDLRPDLLAVLVGGLLMLGMGFWDDRHHLGAGTKFVGQLLVAAIAVWMGVRFLGGELVFSWAAWPSIIIALVTVLWIVGATNALNLIDGSDGVASGTAIFIAGALIAAFLYDGDPLGALMTATVAGACVGFLFFNFPPATIFLGDSGSLFLGFTLASLGVVSTRSAPSIVAVAVPIVAFGVPLLDTGLAIIRRFLKGQAIYTPDRGHIHHRLRDLGLSRRGVAAVLYVASAGFASLAVLLIAPERPTVLPVFLVWGTILVIGLRRLDAPELGEVWRTLRRLTRQRRVVSANLRVKAACDALDASQSGSDVIAALQMAFLDGEFVRLQARLPAEIGKPLEERLSAFLRPDGDRYLLDLDLAPDPTAEELVEIRIPLSLHGRQVGYLGLFRSPTGHLETTLEVLARGFAPALLRTLQRLPTMPAVLSIEDHSRTVAAS